MPLRLAPLLVPFMLHGCAPGGPTAPTPPTPHVITLATQPQRTASGTPIPTPLRVPLGTGALTLVWLGTAHVWQCSALASDGVAFAVVEAGAGQATYDALGYAEVLERVEHLPRPSETVVAGSQKGATVLVARLAGDAAKVLVDKTRIEVTSWQAP